MVSIRLGPHLPVLTFQLGVARGHQLQSARAAVETGWDTHQCDQNAGPRAGQGWEGHGQ